MAQIFPQADDLDKIIKIIKTEKNSFDPEKLKSILKLGTTRQIAYYLSACQFLDILDGNKEFTVFGERLKIVSDNTLLNLLAKKIISKDVFGECFFKSLKEKKLIKRDDVAQLILSLTEINNYSVAYRRAQTVISWLSKIFNYYDLEFEVK